MINNDINNKDRIWCFAPWYNILFYTASNDMSVAPCCYWGPGFVTIKEIPRTQDEIMHLYNAGKFRELRKHLISGDVSGTPCEGCYERLLNTVGQGTSLQLGEKLPKLSLNTSKQFNTLHTLADKSYRTGSILLDQPPLSYYFFLSQRCNLHCIMCAQNHADSFVAPVASIIKLLSAQGFDKIDQVGLIGGEPLFTTDGLELIHYLGTEGISGVNVFVTTNGTLLKQQLATLLPIPNLKLTISIDGGDKKTYEFIRGASWEKVEENLRLLARQDVRRPQWDISINCCVMKSNICHLDKLVELAHELNFGITFSAISGSMLETENIVLFDYLLDDLPDWRSHFERTLAKAEQYGMQKTIVWLKLLQYLIEVPPKITRDMMKRFWEYGWKLNKEIAYFQLNKIYCAKMRVGHDRMDAHSVEEILFPGKWKVQLLCRLRNLEKPLVRTFPALRKIERILSRFV